MAAVTLSAENVLVVYRLTDGDSQEFAELYRDLHGLDSEQVLGIPCSDQEILDNYSSFQSEVEDPIWSAINSPPLSGRQIFAIVLCPFVCGGFRDGSSIISSTSRLSRIGHTYIKDEKNPIYDRQVFKRYDSDDRSFCVICTRFDAPTISIAKAWFQNSKQAFFQKNVSGTFYIDPYSSYQGSDALNYEEDIIFFQEALLNQLGLDISSVVQIDPYIDPVIGSVESDSIFWGWGADRGSLSFFKDTINLRAFFYNADFDGSSTMRDIDATTWPLLAIRSNYVATAGSMSDPGYESFLRPLPFFDTLFRGATLGEAFCFSQPTFNSSIAVFGDPLLTFIFPNQYQDTSYYNVDDAWQYMADYLAQAITLLYRKHNLILGVSDTLLQMDSVVVSDDLVYIFDELQKVYDDTFWKNSFINLSKSLVNFVTTKNKSSYSFFYPTLDDYLTISGNKISSIILDTMQNEQLKQSISSSNIRQGGSWQFDFNLSHTPGAFSFYHIEMDVALDEDFNNIIFTKSTLNDLTGWKYKNFANEFIDFPYNGITSNYAGRTIRYYSQNSETLTRGEFYYFRVRQRDQEYNYSSYSYYKKIIYT